MFLLGLQEPCFLLDPVMSSESCAEAQDRPLLELWRTGGTSGTFQEVKGDGGPLGRG